MPHYIALIHESGNADYRVDFPDFPGCDAAGKTPAEAWVQARNALSSRVEHLRSAGLNLPIPSRLSTVAGLRTPSLHDVFSVRV